MLHKNRFFTFLVFLIFTFVTNCAQSNSHEISIDEFISELENNPNLLVLDVRTEHELIGHLGKIDSVVHIEISELAGRISELEEYKEKEIAVICRSGVRSARGTKLLNDNGFKAKNVLGGMIAFRQHEK